VLKTEIKGKSLEQIEKELVGNEGLGKRSHKEINLTKDN
jgi:hypothetical protein